MALTGNPPGGTRQKAGGLAGADCRPEQSPTDIPLQASAESRCLDPDKWFNNVEMVTAEKIGRETTTYVRNIFKYYVSYKLTNDARAQAEKLKQQVAPK